MKVVNIYDNSGPNDDSSDGPIINIDTHPKLSSDIKEEVLRYLQSGTLILVARHLEEELITHEKSAPTATWHTDGEYIWRVSVEYYLKHYDLAPDKHFVDYVLNKHGELAKPLSQKASKEAMAFLGISQ